MIHLNELNEEIRCVYHADFQDGFSYIGTTNDYEARIKEHLFTDKNSQVYQHKRHTGLIPSFKMIHDYVSICESNELEMLYTIKYASSGRRMLNSAKPGGYKNKKEDKKDVGEEVKEEKKKYICNESKKLVPYRNIINGDFVEIPLSLIYAPVSWSVYDYRILVALCNNKPWKSNAEIITIYINMVDIAIKCTQYDELPAYFERLSHKLVPVYEGNNIGYRPIVHIRFAEKRRTTVIVTLSNVVIRNYYRGKYCLCKKSVLNSCRSLYTPHIYMILCSMLDEKKLCVGCKELQEMLCLKTLEKETYPKWKDFKKRVIDPSQIELKSLFDEERSDFYFEYTPIYEEGRAQRGNPDKIRFELIFAKNAEAIEMSDEAPKVDNFSHGGLQQYVNDLRAAWNGDEEKRMEYPNWERDYPKYKNLYV